MPGFISHTIMANDVYNKLEKKNVNLEYMITFSLGGDLSKYSKCRHLSHHKDMDKFIYNMADYIKNNELINENTLGVLYGHICHYIMDSTVHPLVYAVDKKCKKNKHNHADIELYYDMYLLNKKYNLEVRKYLKNVLLNKKIKKDIKYMIDYAYIVTYNNWQLSKYYKINLRLYRLLRIVYRVFSNKIIEKVTGLGKFINNNKTIILDNRDHLIIYSNYKKKESTDSLMELYNESINRAVKYIDDINKYLSI